jgi:hypothetical protein
MPPSASTTEVAGKVFSSFSRNLLQVFIFDQGQGVIGSHRFGMRGESVFVQSLIEKYPGVVAGERPAGPVGAVHTGGQSDDQQSCILVSERRYRTAVIAGIFFGYFIEESYQPRALAAVFVEYSRAHLMNPHSCEADSAGWAARREERDVVVPPERRVTPQHVRRVASHRVSAHSTKTVCCEP